MGYEIRLKEQQAVPLAVLRLRARVDEFARVVPEACGRVWDVIREQKVEGAGRLVAVYRDEQGNLEVGVELKEPFGGAGEVVGSEIPAGTVAATTHFGPYGGLGDAHGAIHRWGRENGVELVRPCWEVYGHWKDEWNADPSLIRTDVYYLTRSDPRGV